MTISTVPLLYAVFNMSNLVTIAVKVMTITVIYNKKRFSKKTCSMISSQQN